MRDKEGKGVLTEMGNRGEEGCGRGSYYAVDVEEADNEVKECDVFPMKIIIFGLHALLEQVFG